METEKVRYGESFKYKVESDDTTAQTATFYVGKAGQSPVITVPATFENGVAYIESDPEQTEIPLGTYKYQITISYTDGRVLKFPRPKKDCDDCPSDEEEENLVELPDFIIYEALDEAEVS